MPKQSPSSKTFPTMGTTVASTVSAAKPERGIAVKRNNSKGGSTYPEATKANRTGVLERNGFKGAPQMNMSYATAPEAGLNQRNTVVVPASMGNRDFYLKRQYGQVLQ